jgi:MFS family permease
MVAPAASMPAEDLGITSTVETTLAISVFVLAYGTPFPSTIYPPSLLASPAFGPLLLGPLSEIYGRSRIIQYANLWFLI